MRERPRPASASAAASAHRQPLRATYDTATTGRGGMGAGSAQFYKGGAARGLDRAVERELTQLKRMFGL